MVVIGKSSQFFRRRPNDQDYAEAGMCGGHNRMLVIKRCKHFKLRDEERPNDPALF